MQAELVQAAVADVLNLRNDESTVIKEPQQQAATVADNPPPLVITVPEVAEETNSTAPTFVFAQESPVSAAETEAIPSEETPLIEAAAQAVETAAAEVMGKATETVAAPAPADPIDNPISGQSAATEIDHLNLGGLVLVQTDPAALSADRPEPEPPHTLHRADRPPVLPSAATSAQELQQVETHRG